MSAVVDLDAKKCRICGTRTALSMIGRVINNYPLSRCASCDTIMVETRPEADELVRTYNSLFEDGEYEQHRIEFEILKSGKRPPNFFRSRWLNRIGKKCDGRRLVEIGGGTGAFGILASERGWDYTNYDISAVAVNYCRSLSLKADLFSAEALPSLLPQSVDVMVMWEVLEHVWNVDEYLHLIRETLKRNGVFLFSTPNYLVPGCQTSDQWGILSAPPIHLNFFTRESLLKTLHLTGFELVHVFKRRLYRPTFKTLTKCLRAALLIDEPETLWGFAVKNSL